MDIVAICETIDSQLLDALENIMKVEDKESKNKLIEEKSLFIESILNDLVQLMGSQHFDKLQIDSNEVVEKGFLKFLIGIIETIKQKNKYSLSLLHEIKGKFKMWYTLLLKAIPALGLYINEML